MFTRRPLTLTIVLLALMTLLPDARAFHHPRLGRFMQRDPIGYRDGMSVYHYQRLQPITHADPSGKVVILAHGGDGRGWYGIAKDEINKRFPKEDVIEFKYDLAEPLVDYVFEDARIVMDATYLQNAFKWHYHDRRAHGRRC